MVTALPCIHIVQFHPQIQTVKTSVALRTSRFDSIDGLIRWVMLRTPQFLFAARNWQARHGDFCALWNSLFFHSLIVALIPFLNYLTSLAILYLTGYFLTYLTSLFCMSFRSWPWRAKTEHSKQKCVVSSPPVDKQEDNFTSNILLTEFYFRRRRASLRVRSKSVKHWMCWKLYSFSKSN